LKFIGIASRKAINTILLHKYTHTEISTEFHSVVNRRVRMLEIRKLLGNSRFSSVADIIHISAMPRHCRH